MGQEASAEGHGSTDRPDDGSPSVQHSASKEGEKSKTALVNKSNGSGDSKKSSDSKNAGLRNRRASQEEMQVRRSLHANMNKDITDDCLPFSTKVIFCLPTVSTLPVIVLLAAYGNSLYELCGAELSLISACIAGARSMDVITDPGMSYITDAFRSRWGRRRPFLATGCWPYALSLILLLTPPYGSSGFVGGWFGAMYIMYFLTNTYTTIPYDALGPELTDNYDDRSRLFFISGIFDGLGTMAAVGSPIVFEMMVRSTSVNDNICRPDGSSDNVKTKCKEGMTCDRFIEDSGKPFTAWDRQSAADIAWLAQATQANLTTHCEITENIQNYYVDLPAPHEAYCICVRDCTSACALANKRYGFMAVGITFGGWFIIFMMLLVFRIKERSQVEKAVMKKNEKRVTEREGQAALMKSRSSFLAIENKDNGKDVNPPIVPLLLTTLFNQGFTVLLPAWACDGMVNAIIAALLTYYVRYVIAPEYQNKKDHGRDCAQGVNGLSGAPNYSVYCSTEMVLGGCMVALFVFAAAATPMWLYLVQRIGKVKTWLLWSLVMAVTNILFVIPGKGDIYLCAVVCGLNGVPLGAKFLADAILSDIIDYDEFLTGSRREATYTMFKSFLPKIMAIPSIAIPISLMNAVGHKEPKNGLIQPQPDAVPIFLKLVGAVLTSAVSWLAFWLKRRFPLKTKAQVDMIAEGVAKHYSGEPSIDPISGRMFMYTKFTDEEMPYVWQIDHFIGSKMVDAIQRDIPEGTKNLLFKTQVQLALMIVVFLISFVLCIIFLGPLKLMSNDSLSFIPTLTIVSIGMSVVMIVFCLTRFQAARKIIADPPSAALLQKIFKQRKDLESLQTKAPVQDMDSFGGFLPPIQVAIGKSGTYQKHRDTE